MNQTTIWPLWHCECIRSFYTCLNNLNTTLSNEFAVIHSINTTKCISNDYPIVKCNKFEKYTDSISQLFEIDNFNEGEEYFKRCVVYELDRNRKKELQIFDMPFNSKSGIGTFLKTKQK